MTKKDYQRIAQVFKDAIDREILAEAMGQKPHSLFLQNARILAEDLARSFYLENQRFDRDRFIKAAGFRD